MRRSLRTTLVLGTSAGATLVLVLSSLLLYVLISRALWAAFDASLESKARSLALMIEQEGDRLELDFDEARPPEFEPSEHAEVYQVWLSDGRALARSRSLNGADLPLLSASGGKPTFQSVTLPDGRPARLVGVQVTPLDETAPARRTSIHQLTFVVGRETEAIVGTLRRIRLLMIGVCAAAMVITAGVLAWFVRRGLRPVDALSKQIAKVDTHALDNRIHNAAAPRELEPIVDRLNNLLARLEAAFERERRFTGDVAHELRTPLAGLRARLEVALTHVRPAEAYRQVLDDCRGIGLHMQRIVESLLHLARADAGQLETRRESVDVPAILRGCWAPHEENAKARGISVNWQLSGRRIVETDRDKLALVVQNILDNAASYVNSDGVIDITTAEADRMLVIGVRNTGCTLPARDVARVFDRFWRRDASHDAAGQAHAGLGLPLAQAVLTVMGGSIAARLSPPDVFAIDARLPSAGAAPCNQKSRAP